MTTSEASPSWRGNEYTPSTEEVREQYWAASGEPSRGSESKPEFDRWLAAHDKAIRDAALTEAAEAVDRLTGVGGADPYVVKAACAQIVRHLQEGDK